MEAILSHLQSSTTAELQRFSSQFVPFASCIGTDGIRSCYHSFDPSVTALWLCILLAVYCLIWSIVGQNCSKVDQIWSITPVVYSWTIYAWPSSHHAGHNTRLFVVATIITIWGVRLTYNFWRRGGYGNLITHEEDYRWAYLRAFFNNNTFLFFIFNVTFIASYQNVLLYLIAMPLITVSKGPTQMNTWDWIVSALLIVLIVVETTADQQHWEFHKRKNAVPASKRSKHADVEIREGFNQSGLFYYSRHPNYFCEQSIWVMVYLFSITHAQTPAELFNFWGLGAVLLILLFQASMAFSESITASKYPAYKEYQRRTSQCLPMFPRPRADVKKST